MKIIICLFLFLSFSALSNSQSISEIFSSLDYSNDKNLTEQIDDMLEEQFPKLHVPSFVVGVSDDYETLYTKAYGHSDYVDKPYAIGSMTKSFTALSIMILVSQGALNLDDTLDKITNDKGDSLNEYFKDSSELKEITIRQLLSHTAGLESMMKKGKAKINKDKKGKFNYSNYGYGVLGRIVEIKSSLSYADFLEEKIFSQLGMNKTTAKYEEGEKNGLVQGHQNIFGFYFASKIFKKAYDEDGGLTIPAGFITSTVEDMLKYLRFMMSQEDFLLPYEYKQMLLNCTVDTGTGAKYGFGWQYKEYKGKDSETYGCYHHEGLVNSYNSIMLFIPEKNISAVGIFNGYDMFSLTMHQEVRTENIINIIIGNAYKDIGSSFIVTHLMVDAIYFIILVVYVLDIIHLIVVAKSEEKFPYFSCRVTSILIMILDLIILILVPVGVYGFALIEGGGIFVTLDYTPDFYVYFSFAILGHIILISKIIYYICRMKEDSEGVDITTVDPMIDLALIN